MTTSMSAGSIAFWPSRRDAASTDMSLTCSSAPAMCFPRRPNFSRITCSGIPLAPAISAALIQVSGR